MLPPNCKRSYPDKKSNEIDIAVESPATRNFADLSPFRVRVADYSGTRRKCEE